MYDKNNVFLVTEEALINALEKYGKGINSKDYEFAVSIHMKRNLEKSYNSPFCIAFEIKNDIRNLSRNFKPTPEETNDIIRKMLNENTPVDFGLVKGTIDKHDPTAFAFQVKKFPIHNLGTFNEDLVTYINKVSGGYRSGEVSLIVVPTNSYDKNKPNSTDIGNIFVNYDYIKKSIIIPKNSFCAIFLMLSTEEITYKKLY
ncbi:hypothetical protein HYV31_02010 [candidate division WWE3 bacterium]|nr:hypothetical protein [candidate division WWE3 bacterium]